MSSDNGTNGFGNGFGGNGNGALHNENLFGREEEQEISLQDILEKIYRRKTAVILIFTFVVLLATLYTFLKRPTYESTAQVLIQKNKSASSSIFGSMSDLLQPFESDERRITNELDILQTNLLRTDVAEQLILNPLVQENGRADSMEIITGAVAALKKDQGKHHLTLIDLVKGTLKRDVSFSNDRNSDIIKISVKSHTPEESAQIANIYAHQYYDLNLSSSRNMATNVRKFLGKQLGDTRQQLDVAENNLEVYMKNQGIVSLSDEAKQMIEAMSTFQAQRDDVVVQMKSQQQVLEAYQSQLAKLEPSITSNVSEAVDPYITMLQQQIAKLEVNRDVAVAQNPIVGDRAVYNQIIAQADSQIADLRRKLKAKTAQFLSAQITATGSPSVAQGGGGTYDPTGYYKELKLRILQQEIDLHASEAQNRELSKIVGQYDAEFSKIPKQYIELAKLERTEKSREKLFLLIQDNYQQAEIAEQSQFGYVQIVDPAIPVSKPVSPKVPLNLTLGVLLGLALGIGWVFVLDYMDRSIKSPEDLEKKGLNVLASIPIMGGASARNRENVSEQMVVKDGVTVPLRLITFHKPSDPISEAYRSLRTAIQYSRIDKPLKSLLVVSALPKEGKSTTTANIAVTFAKAGMKVLLVDADLRRPIQHRMFNCDRKPGLIEYLKGEVDLNTAVRKTFVENLFLLPTGALPPNPAEVLGSDSMRNSLEIFKASFDMVIFDSPPVVAVTDGVLLSKLTDGVVFVTLANRTEVDVLEKAYMTLRQVKAGVIGVVLNEFDVSKAYGAYYRYYRYYHYYGHKEEKEA
ncbi:MAG: polysaccharide biosynthesis tyrosine autokinase [Bacteroidetes bacterium]|nr:polysaccharide biosynthesis tyrosine autokinase [Bacteroidota bacterium]